MLGNIQNEGYFKKLLINFGRKVFRVKREMLNNLGNEEYGVDRGVLCNGKKDMGREKCNGW